MANRNILGIDLGTTNCSLSYSVSSSSDAPKVIEIIQVLKPGLTQGDFQMPSAIYIPFNGEFKGQSLGLPWAQEDQNTDYIIGKYAKEKAVDVPDRVVLSAKSWLCQSIANRRENILPWGSQISESKISPFDASVAYLKYLKNAFLYLSRDNIEKIDYDVIVTVPASFDEIARNLTFQAALDSGFERVSLLEEPLAAFYSWVSHAGDNWRELVSVGDIVLVCDIGGGTADFSLIYVGEENGELSLQRLSVGRHLLLGGDNMDLALAYGLKGRLEESGKSIDHWQFQSLIHQARNVKERMLSEEIETLPVAIAGKGSSLFSSTLKIEINRAQVIEQILEGFFPNITLAESKIEVEDSGLSELGLPYETEPALTKHLGIFLKNSSSQIASLSTISSDLKTKAQSTTIFPNLVLFNGGVCSSVLVREKIKNVLKTWSGAEITELQSNDLHTAVAQGACYYGRVKASGTGIKIKAGVPRSFYLGLKSALPAVPGFKPQVKGLCIVPQGMEEGSSTSLSEEVFSLLTGQEVSFRLFTSDNRGQDKFGDFIQNAEKELVENTCLRVLLPQEVSKTEINSGLKEQPSAVSVRLYSQVNELGMLELWMQAVDSDRSWKLEFDVRKEKKTLESQKNLNQQPISPSNPIVLN